MSRYSDNFVKLMEKSGCVEVNFGAETGSKRLLSLINKDVSPEMMYKSLEKLKINAPSIEPYVFWMSGLPTETMDDLKETYNVMDKLSTINEKTQHVEICIYTPFPSPMLQAFSSQYNFPETLEEWGKIDVFHFRPPWHDKKYVDMLESLSTVTKFTFYPETRIKEMNEPYRTAYNVMHWLAEKRWRHKYFGLPVDLKLARFATNKVRGY
jgi:anaerobic magnesium-protoporphyrin IX monomethyl ester cyclase